MVHVFQRVRMCSLMVLVSVVGLPACTHNPSAVLGPSEPVVRMASKAPSSIVPDGLGVNIHWTNPRPGEMRMLAATGVRWIRMDFSWSATEAKKGQYNFAPYIRLISALRRYHIRPCLFSTMAIRCTNTAHFPPRREHDTRLQNGRWRRLRLFATMA